MLSTPTDTLFNTQRLSPDGIDAWSDSTLLFLRRTKMAGYLEWKVKRVQSRIILLVPMNSQTTEGQARELS